MRRTSCTVVIAALLLGVPPAMAGAQALAVPLEGTGAEEEAPTDQATPPTTPTESPAPNEGEAGPAPSAGATTWIDSGHSAFSEGLFWPIGRFDRFFADEREVETPRARSFIRWRNQVRFEDDRDLSFGTSLRADLRFPHLSRRLKRLRLTLEGDTREAIQDLIQPGEPPLAPSASGRVSAGLRFDLFQSLLTQADLQAGLLFQLPVGLFTRARLRHVQPVAGLFQVRTSTAGFWQTTTGWGTRQDVDLERPFGQALLLRLANNASFTQKSRGLEWLSELSLLRTFGTRSAISLTGSAAGASDAGPVVERYRLATRLRWEAYRSWIFLELEPEGTWTRPLGGGRRRVLAVIFRVELQFQDGAGRSP